MAQAVKASMEELLVPFQAASDAPESLRNMNTDDFFRAFLVYADKFTGECCRELSKIFRQVSLTPEVRGTPTLELAKKIRQTVFEKLDMVLVSYVDSLKQINLDLGGVVQGLSDSSVLAEALKGAAIGRVAGGFGDTGKVFGTVGAIAAAGKEAEKQQALLALRQKLMDEARSLAFSKIIDYLKEVELLPENLLDYGCAKCFGGEIDFSKQALAVEFVRESVGDKIRRALELTLNLERMQKEEASRVATAMVQAASEKTGKATAAGCGGCLLVIGVLVLIGGIGQIFDSKSDPDDPTIVLACVGGLGLIIAGIVAFTMKKRQSG